MKEPFIKIQISFREKNIFYRNYTKFNG